MKRVFKKIFKVHNHDTRKICEIKYKGFSTGNFDFKCKKKLLNIQKEFNCQIEATLSYIIRYNVGAIW